LNSLLDNEALSRLRDAVRDIQTHDGGPIPHPEIIALANALGPDKRVTLDLTATNVLGTPLVVIGSMPPEPQILSVLTPRERQVAALLASGLTNKGIALKLALSPATVKDHIHHILKKTGLPTRAAVAAYLAS